MTIQFLIITFLAFALASVVVRFRKKQISLRDLLLWAGIWVAAGVVVLLPQTTSFLADKVGIGRGVDLVVYASVLFLFFALFRIMIKLDRMEGDLTTVVRSLAIASAKEGKAAKRKESERGDERQGGCGRNE